MIRESTIAFVWRYFYVTGRWPTITIIANMLHLDETDVEIRVAAIERTGRLRMKGDRVTVNTRRRIPEGI